MFQFLTTRANPSFNPRLTRSAWLLAILLLCVGATQVSAQSNQRLIVHEWGIITTIAQADGRPMTWTTDQGQAPLPGFMHLYDHPKPQAVNARLEIPAIFFRVDQPTPVALSLNFLPGHFRSCYPRAQYEEYALSWPEITLLPGNTMPLLNDPSASGYMQARNTTAAQVRIDHAGHKQFERFIHIQASGNLRLPLQITANEEEYRIVNSDLQAEPVTTAVLIENRKGKTYFQPIELKGSETRIPRPKKEYHIDLAVPAMQKILNQMGFYPDEARAVLAGCRHDWFEPGVRVIYFLPRSQIDTTLQATLSPLPSEHLRVHAVRVELITPEIRQAMLQQLASLDMQSPQCVQALLNSSRLTRPMLRQLYDASADQAVRGKIATLLQDEDPLP